MKKVERVRWAGALIWMLLLVLTPLFANTQNTRRTIRAVWTENPPVIDGDLTEPVWQYADIATNFFRAKEGETHPAELDTEVRVLYDENTLYIGVRCEEPDMKSLRETLTRRDSFVWQNDCIEVMLDTYHDRRNCYIFAVNTLGTQADERVGNESVFDMSWDAKWEAKVKKHSDHWTAEFAIPFREVRFNRRNTTWGINFWRVRPINGQSHSWAETAFFSRVSEYGNLTGLDLERVKTEQKVGILPYGSYRALVDRPNDLDGGLDLILPISTYLTSNVTLNPDFSQLESDPTEINVSSDRELFLPERRPFFREGAELFELPLDLFYTRRVQEIDVGAKTAGRIGGSNFAIINTYGKMIDRYDGDAKKQVNLLAGRINHDIGDRTVIGAMESINTKPIEMSRSYRSMDGLDCIETGLRRRSTLSIGLMARCTGRTTPPRNGFTKGGWARFSLKRFRTVFVQTRWGSKRRRSVGRAHGSGTGTSFQRRISWSLFGLIHVIFIKPMLKGCYGND